jgi:metal iron transporter
MPHSLYLGSGIVQSRLKDFDDHRNEEREAAHLPIQNSSSFSIDSEEKYRPSLPAIRSCLKYSIIELGISLFTFALFVNSAILIVAGASLSNLPADEIDKADLFSIHDLLSKSLAPAAGTIFALALLLSGTSAGIVCTIAGQMVSEGQLNWTVKPWVRRLITRSISITPSIIIAGAVGREGLSTALEASQVCLSVILPFVSAPLIYFTCRSGIMSVWAESEPTEASPGESTGQPGSKDEDVDNNTPDGGRIVVMRNSLLTSVAALVIWGIVVIMNVALLVLVGLKKT